MHTFTKRLTFRLASALLLALSLWLSYLMPIGRASTLHQTIPTAPPPTVVAPTTAASQTPTSAPPATAIPTQPRLVTATQTEGVIASETARAVTPSPSGVPGRATSSPGGATVVAGKATTPPMTATQLATGKTESGPSSSAVATGTGSTETQAPGAIGFTAYVIGFGVGVVLLIGVRAWLKRRKR